MLSATCKLWEEVLRAKLWTEVATHMPLHENQRGFVPGGSCIKNLDDLIHIVEEVKQKRNTGH